MLYGPSRQPPSFLATPLILSRWMQLQRYATPNVLQKAAQSGCQVVRIDRGRPLAEQGPFNVIIHKLVPCDPFYKELESYVSSHPHTRVIDEVKRVASLQSRCPTSLPPRTCSEIHAGHMRTFSLVGCYARVKQLSDTAMCLLVVSTDPTQLGSVSRRNASCRQCCCRHACFQVLTSHDRG